MTNVIKAVVGSKNPIKVAAAKQALALVYPDHTIDCIGISAPSGVAEQPMTEAETLLGAENRVQYCRSQEQADFYIAIEGGVDKFAHGVSAFAYIVIEKTENQSEQLEQNLETPDCHQLSNTTTKSIGRSADLPLPLPVYDALVAGEELGDVMDRLFNTKNIKQQGGAMGLLTNNLATRGDTYQQAVILALAPFIKPLLFNQ